MCAERIKPDSKSANRLSAILGLQDPSFEPSDVAVEELALYGNVDRVQREAKDVLSEISAEHYPEDTTPGEYWMQKYAIAVARLAANNREFDAVAAKGAFIRRWDDPDRRYVVVSHADTGEGTLVVHSVAALEELRDHARDARIREGARLAFEAGRRATYIGEDPNASYGERSSTTHEEQAWSDLEALYLETARIIVEESPAGSESDEFWFVHGWSSNRAPGWRV